MTEITFPSRVEWGAYGRNGPMHQLGIEVLDYGTEIVLHPITTRGSTSSARLSIPLVSLPAFIAALEGLLP